MTGLSLLLFGVAGVILMVWLVRGKQSKLLLGIGAALTAVGLLLFGRQPVKKREQIEPAVPTEPMQPPPVRPLPELVDRLDRNVRDLDRQIEEIKNEEVPAPLDRGTDRDATGSFLAGRAKALSDRSGPPVDL